ncbi:MAG TPA: SusC/RagA family TonB-linked outer membrane protein [Flavobacteriaceae bacterium]|nr:SusC/RagA family TonB-linked outer membrane protein [Flavobacteriaceae bacterium]
MKTILKSALTLLLMCPLGLLAQSTIQGTVTDAKTGMPLPGVNVVIEGTQNGSITDFDGHYSLSVQGSDPVTVVFSYLGYSTQKLETTVGSTLDVALQQKTASLDEVVLIGYGETTKQDATGAVDKISEESFNSGAITSPAGLIAGKSAGVLVTGSGAPGGGAAIRIRGGSSLSANNDPLIVVDGMPLDQRGVQGVRSQLNAINPDEVESFVILKDAAATAIYGSRASNGVILITTKKGSRSKDFTVSYDLKTSVSTVTDFVDILDADQLREIIETTPGTDPSLLGNANTDWQDEIYRTGFGNIHNLTATQGFENFYYRVNFNHTSQEGILKTDKYTRNALNLSFTQNLLDNDLELSVIGKGIINENDYADNGAIGAAVNFDPTQPVFDPSSPFGGYFEFRDGENQFQQATRNPVALLYQYKGEATSKRAIANFKADYKFRAVKGLRFNLNLGVDYAELEGSNFRPINSAIVLQDIPDQEFYSGINRNTLMDFYFNYKKPITSINTEVDLTAGHSYQEFYISSDSRFTKNNEWETRPTSINRNALESYFARASFDISNKYLISASYRRDGSSRFSEDNRWSSFPAVSVGWKIGNENFLKNSKVVSDLKLRAGYGVTGNQEIGRNYGYIGLYTPSIGGASVQFGDQFISTLRPEEFDENLKWEELKTYNVGLDFGFFKDRLTGSVNAYHRTTEDLLAEVPVPAGSNLSDRLVTNVGQTTSRGLEIGLSGDLVRNDNFNWNMSYNITFQELEITKLALGNNPNFFIPQGGISGGVGNMVQIWKEGYDPSTFFVFRQVYDESGNPVEGAYVDVNGDNTITEADRQPYKKASPDYFMGFTNSISYKNFNFDFTFRGSFGGYNYNNTKSNMGYLESATVHPQAYYTNLHTDALESNFVNSQFFSDYYIRSSDFIKLDNISVGYLIPYEKSSLRASFTVTNVLTITDYEGLDPEVFGGIDNNIYPRPRTYVLGLHYIF